MALKERKQITGTTAQIDVYAGHEGQILWDKEKKTLVGMSGTAGKNYPLAQQAYVDNEVSKVNTEVAKKASSAELTQGLAGKEDKGVCLPLTGGNLTGPLFLTETSHIWTNADEINKGLELGGGSTLKNGATLFLSHNNSPKPEDSGQWVLFAHKATSEEEGVLLGRTDNIWFNGNVVERSSEVFGSTFDEGFYEVYRYATGLQIIIAGFPIPANQVGTTFTFPRPFSNNSVSIAANAATSFGDVAVTWDEITTTSVHLYRKFFSGYYDFATHIRCIFIGRWK